MLMSNVSQFRPRNPVCLPDDSLRRPRPLVSAARAGLAGYRRGRELPRLLKTERLPHPRFALRRLREIEAALDETRLSGATGYDLKRHILVLIAILAEMRELAALSAPGTATPARP